MNPDHDFLMQLLKNDPKKFEEFCRSEIDKVISAAPVDKQHRLRGQQWKIDQELARCPDNVQRYNKMVEIFWKGVIERYGAIEQKPDEKQADILKFPK